MAVGKKYRIQIQLLLKLIAVAYKFQLPIFHSNTTLVKVNQLDRKELMRKLQDSNTTLVKVNPRTTDGNVLQTAIFKYNSC